MIEHPYASFLTQLKKPGRYVGGEYGAAEIPDDAALRVVLSYPDSYEIGMSHIGLSVLYEIVGALPRMSCERVFMPWPDLEAALVAREIPLVSLESARPLCEFDVVGFSLQFELNYTNLIAMLSLGKIPRRSASRSEDDPLVLVGGPLAAHCEPIAPFVDLCLLGDGEEALPQLLEKTVWAKQAGLSRAEMIAALHELPEIYAPSLLERFRDEGSRRFVVKKTVEPVAHRAVVSGLGAYPTGLGPVPSVEAVFDRCSIEVARGCASGCRFCQAGFLYRPVRERTEFEVQEAAERAVGQLGFDEISLASLSTADHSRVEPMIANLGKTLTPRRVSLAVPSLRAYGLPDDLVEVLGRLRATGVTLAPEAGSQRLRDTVNKNVTEKDLIDAAIRFFEWGFKRIKLYFMLGLPGETDEDLVEIVELSDRLRQAVRRRIGGHTPAVTISVSTFVPKPFTPFEREEMIGLDEIKRRQGIIAGLGKKKRLEVRSHDPRLSVLEGILCRGDSSVADLLERAVDLGARFDGWNDMYDESIWNTVLGKIDVPSHLAEIPDSARVPWDHLNLGVEPKFLLAERDRARAAQTTPPCGRFTVRPEEKTRTICNNCGLSCKPEILPVRQQHKKNDDSLQTTRQTLSRTKPRAAEHIANETSVRVRLFFAKWGRQIFVGHLDTMRHLMRSLRRAGFEIAYTKGFHPKPKVESAPPLPLGVAGMREPLDVFLIDPPSEDEILRRLANSVPPDLAIVEAAKIPPATRSLGKSLESADYLALVDASGGEVNTGMSNLLDASSFLVTRTRKGKTKEVDIRPYLLGASVLDMRPPDLQFLPSSDRVCVAFSLAIPGSGGARPAEIVDAILGGPSKDAWIVRKQIILS